MDSVRKIAVASDKDVVLARQIGRDMAAELGFTRGDQTVIAAAISEVARNILTYARTGDVTLQAELNGDHSGLIIVAHDDGPGIADIELAMQDGFSTSGGLGLGLSGSKRLMDEFEVISARHAGTTVTMRKWRKHA